MKSGLHLTVYGISNSNRNTSPQTIIRYTFFSHQGEHGG